VNSGQIVSSIISGAAVLLLAGIARGLLGTRRDFRRFMAEHTWLLATTLWTRDKVIQIMERMDMPLDTDGMPPSELPH
jgi:hypothetical protein